MNIRKTKTNSVVLGIFLAAVQILVIAGPVQAAAPIISNVNVINISHTSVTIEWDTDAAATQSRVIYSTTATNAPFDYSTYKKSGSSTIHGFTVGGLAPATTYNFQACSSISGVEGCSATRQFTTSPAPVDRFRNPTLPSGTPIPAMPIINGNTYTVAADCSDLQSKINTAASISGSANHQILIPVQATCNGNYGLPSRSGTGWITIRSAASDTQLPAEGVRATTTDAQYMPTFHPLNQYFNSVGSTFYSNGPTSKWRLMGLNMVTNSDNHGAHVYLGTDSADIVIDRCILVGNNQVVYGILSPGTRTVIVNNYINMVKPGGLMVAIDFPYAQGLTVDNNYINAPGISVFAEEGGGLNAAPTDITITRNLFEWDSQYTETTVVRQHLEFKTGKRILIDSNVFRNEWAGGITGSFSNAIIFTPRAGWNGPIHGTLNQISDVTITNNILHNIPGGINIMGNETSNIMADVPATKRILIKNNLMYDVNGFYAKSGVSVFGSPLFLAGALEDVVVDHNTFFNPRGNLPYFMFWLDGRGSGLKVKNNVIGYNKTNNAGGFGAGSDVTGILPALNKTSVSTLFGSMIQASPNSDPTMEFSGNLIVPGVADTSSATYYDSTSSALSKTLCDAYWSVLPGNTCAGGALYDTANKVFNSLQMTGPLTTWSGYQFSSNSVYKNGASDGTDFGPNMTTIATAYTTATANGSPVVETTPPVISTVSANTPLATSTQITWVTNENSDSQVEYGLTASYGSASTLDPALNTSHSVTLTGLAGGTQYHYRVKSRDAAGNLALSADQSFTTPAIVVVYVDTAAPVVNLTAPTLNSTVSGSSVVVSATASDNVGISGVKFYYGTKLIGSEVVVSPYSILWDTTKVTNATYSIIAVARDSANNITTSSPVSVTVNNATSSGRGGGPRKKIKIELQGTTSNDVSGTLAYVDPVSGTTVSTQSFTTDTTGEYSFDLPSGLPSGTILRVSTQGYLPKVYTGSDLTAPSVETISIPELPAGDFNGDGVINSIDYSQLNQKWNTTSQAGIYDINRDGRVDSSDLGVMEQNWYLRGE